ncbi:MULTISPECIES: hypothetical protein [unclassified Nocardia]|uniref:hypothetical protein n=1 Tax=unclassified Nocardia TaxID=2637762 RepID=UPI00339EBB7C
MNHAEHDESIGSMLASIAAALREVSDKLDIVAARVQQEVPAFPADEDLPDQTRIRRLETWAFHASQDISRLSARLDALDGGDPEPAPRARGTRSRREVREAAEAAERAATDPGAGEEFSAPPGDRPPLERRHSRTDHLGDPTWPLTVAPVPRSSTSFEPVGESASEAAPFADTARAVRSGRAGRSAEGSATGGFGSPTGSAVGTLSEDAAGSVPPVNGSDRAVRVNGVSRVAGDGTDRVPPVNGRAPVNGASRVNGVKPRNGVRVLDEAGAVHELPARGESGVGDRVLGVRIAAPVADGSALPLSAGAGAAAGSDAGAAARVDGSRGVGGSAASADDAAATVSAKGIERDDAKLAAREPGTGVSVPQQQTEETRVATAQPVDDVAAAESARRWADRLAAAAADQPTGDVVPTAAAREWADRLAAAAQQQVDDVVPTATAREWADRLAAAAELDMRAAAAERSREAATAERAGTTGGVAARLGSANGRAVELSDDSVIEAVDWQVTQRLPQNGASLGGAAGASGGDAEVAGRTVSISALGRNGVSPDAGLSGVTTGAMAGDGTAAEVGTRIGAGAETRAETEIGAGTDIGTRAGAEIRSRTEIGPRTEIGAGAGAGAGDELTVPGRTAPGVAARGGDGVINGVVAPQASAAAVDALSDPPTETGVRPPGEAGVERARPVGRPVGGTVAPVVGTGSSEALSGNRIDVSSGEPERVVSDPRSAGLTAGVRGETAANTHQVNGFDPRSTAAPGSAGSGTTASGIHWTFTDEDLTTPSTPSSNGHARNGFTGDTQRPGSIFDDAAPRERLTAPGDTSPSSPPARLSAPKDTTQTTGGEAPAGFGASPTATPNTGPEPTARFGAPTTDQPSMGLSPATGFGTPTTDSAGAGTTPASGFGASTSTRDSAGIEPTTRFDGSTTDHGGTAFEPTTRFGAPSGDDGSARLEPTTRFGETLSDRGDAGIEPTTRFGASTSSRDNAGIEPATRFDGSTTDHGGTAFEPTTRFGAPSGDDGSARLEPTTRFGETLSGRGDAGVEPTTRFGSSTTDHRYPGIEAAGGYGGERTQTGGFAAANPGGPDAPATSPLDRVSSDPVPPTATDAAGITVTGTFRAFDIERANVDKLQAMLDELKRSAGLPPGRRDVFGPPTTDAG